MKKVNYILIMVALMTGFTSCDKDEDVDQPIETPALVYDYHAHVHSPNSDNKHVNDTLDIEIEFESHMGETIHHINIEIVNVDDNTVVYSGPAEAMVHEHDGSLTYVDEFILSNVNGINGHSDWKLTAKVWGDSPGLEEVSESVNFHVHPE